MAKERILILGGSGFIGKNLIDGLGSDYEILAPIHKELDLVGDDLSDYLRGVGAVTCVVNAAAYGIYGQDLPDMVEKNLRIADNIVRAKNSYKQLINLSSGAVYGKHQPLVTVSENELDDMPVPSDKYGFCNYLAANYLINSTRWCVNLMPFGVFGKYEDKDKRFITHSILQALKGEPIVIYQDVRFTFLSVEDLVAEIKRFIQARGIKGFFNAGGIDVTLKELAVMIGQAAGKRVDIRVLEEGMANEYTCDDGKIRGLMGDWEYTPLDLAVRRLYRHYERISTL